MDDDASNSGPSQIDHIVLLLSPSDFDNIPAWLADNFTVIDGGTHSKGTSHNKLIIFQDGTYLELFSWIEPSAADVPAHADFPGWAHKPLGSIIDWAVTGENAHGKFHDVNVRLEDLLNDGENLNVGYDQPVAGGRTRKDGIELRWVTTRPQRLSTADETADTDLGVPFFCHDVTTREARVPYVKGSIDSWPGLVTHPSGVVGIAGLIVAVPASRLQAFVRLYEAILGVDAKAVMNEGNDIAAKIYRFYLPSPTQVRERRPWYSSGIEGGEVSKPHGIIDQQKSVQSPCFVELQGTHAERPNNSLQKLILRTTAVDRYGERLDGAQLRTPIFLN